MRFLLLFIFPASLWAAETPNILFIYLDDFGWKDTSYMGSDFYETPHLDALAKQGMIFTDAYSAAANCAPARASLLSGQYTPRHKVYNVGTKPRGNAKHRRLEHIPGLDTLDPKIKTWAACVKEAGYTTASMGKWHLSKDPLRHGFDLNIAGGHSGGPPKGYFPPHPNVPNVEGGPEDEYLTDRLSDEAVKWIREVKDQKWFLYLTHFAVHTPLQAKAEDIQYFEQKTPGTLHQHVVMAAMIKSVDEGVGRIVAALEALGLRDNTAIFFFSDNGGYGPATSMAPLRGYKGTYFEGGIREPFFVNWPGVVEAGSTCAEPIIGVDLYPTFCEITGATPPEEHVQDGLSIVPLLTGRPFERDAIYWHFPAYLQSYSRSNEQRDPLFRSRPCTIVRSGDWKLHYYFEDQGMILYNLKTDIGESKDVAQAQADITQALMFKIRTFWKETEADLPLKPNPKFDAEAEAAARASKAKKKKDGGKGKGGK